MPTCQACGREATHVVYWNGPQRGWGIRRDLRPPRWCKWDATVRAVQRNARGLRPRQVRQEEKA